LHILSKGQSEPISKKEEITVYKKTSTHIRTSLRKFIDVHSDPWIARERPGLLVSLSLFTEFQKAWLYGAGYKISPKFKTISRYLTFGHCEYTKLHTAFENSASIQIVHELCEPLKSEGGAILTTITFYSKFKRSVVCKISLMVVIDSGQFINEDYFSI